MLPEIHFCFQVALGLAKLLTQDEGLGLFYVACVPAGGAGHIVVSIFNGDRTLSISLNFFSTVIAAGRWSYFFHSITVCTILGPGKKKYIKP